MQRHRCQIIDGSIRPPIYRGMPVPDDLHLIDVKTEDSDTCESRSVLAREHDGIQRLEAGSLIILGCLIWMQMKSEPLPYGYDLGISFYLAIIAGLLAIGAGFLDMLENDKNPDEDD